MITGVIILDYICNFNKFRDFVYLTMKIYAAFKVSRDLIRPEKY